MHPSLSLLFDGQCEAAFKFYEQVLGGTNSFLMLWGQSPMANEAPSGWEQKILYARMDLGNFTLLGADALPGTYARPAGFAVMLNPATPEAAQRLFTQLSDGGAVRMPLQETFWSAAYGGVTDRFGIPWELNCEKPG